MLVVFFGAKTERPRQTGIEVREAFLDADAEAEVVFPVWKPQGAVVVAAGDNHDLGGFFPIDQGGRLDAHAVLRAHGVAVDVQGDLDVGIFLQIALDGFAGAVIRAIVAGVVVAGGVVCGRNRQTLPWCACGRSKSVWCRPFSF